MFATKARSAENTVIFQGSDYLIRYFFGCYMTEKIKTRSDGCLTVQKYAARFEVSDAFGKYGLILLQKMYRSRKTNVCDKMYEQAILIYFKKIDYLTEVLIKII